MFIGIRGTYDIIEIVHQINEFNGYAKYYKDAIYNNDVDKKYLVSDHRAVTNINLNVWKYGRYYKSKKSYSDTKII